MDLDQLYVAANQPTAKVHIADGTFVKSYAVPDAGTVLPQHSHSYSHTSYIATGAVEVWKGGAFLGYVRAPDGILIEAHALHRFITLEPNTTILCIHSIALGEDEPHVEQEHTLADIEPPSIIPVPPRRDRVPAADVTLQIETIDQWYADARHLFAEHMAATGQGLGDWENKNLPLGRQMDSCGAMYIVTARSANGLMLGYLMSIIGPSLDDPAAKVAQQMTFFASPDCPGLGKKLHEFSLTMLKGMGVTEVLGRAGVRGDGPRMGKLYTRLGFEPAGELYRKVL